MVDYKEELEKALIDNKDSVQAYYDSAQSIIKALDKMLDDDNLTYDEKMQIVNKMQEIQKIMYDKDTENKKCLRDIVAIAGFVVVTVAGVAAALLGGDNELKLPNNKDD